MKKPEKQVPASLGVSILLALGLVLAAPMAAADDGLADEAAAGVDHTSTAGDNGSHQGASEGGPQWSISAQIGGEYDDNPLRRDGYEGDGDGLMRYLVGAEMVHRLSPRRRWSATIGQGGKFFRNESAANALITQLGGAAYWSIHRRLSLQVYLDGKDRSERGRDRDYTRGGAALRLSSRWGPLQFWADGGWRYFAFKPTPISSYDGPMARAGLGWSMAPGLRLEAAWTGLWRDYDGPAWAVEDDRFVPVGDGITRDDRYLQYALTARYEGKINGWLGYRYARNRSNSYGQGLGRHRAVARLTVPLPARFVLSARGELQRARYEDELAIDDVFRLDEDNRNALVAALGRSFGQNWQVELRYALYAHEFGANRQYRRQVLALSVGTFLENP